MSSKTFSDPTAFSVQRFAAGFAIWLSARTGSARTCEPSAGGCVHHDPRALCLLHTGKASLPKFHGA